MNIRTQFQEYASRVEECCSHISVREDEDGPYIFALGLKQTHTLQLRKKGEHYVLQLWHGTDAENEAVVVQPTFETAEAAFSAATEWLQRDAIEQHAQHRPPIG